MAAMSRGPAPKLRAPKKVKGGTASSRRHVFEGFSQRIAKLKIEPVRRGRNTILDDAELNAAFSYFKDSFAEWRELNISEAFTRFARQVSPLCESLPQILHHSDRIIDLLVEYIEKGDKFSEEPLLNLLTHLAHDLDERFEQYFERVVRTVTQLAATHEDVEVIEWSFTCLAWLFKYLFKLLVPDLRPVFDLMAPLLGKEHQKLFVSRFAAESLSFLIRKAGARHHRDPAALKLILQHISDQLKELQGSGKDSEFQQGLMFLLADSLKGVQRGLHSSAVAIFQEMLLQTYDEQHVHLRNPPMESVLIGVVTAVIHHSDADNFKPLTDAVVAKVNATAADSRYLGLSSRILFVICGVRRGSRIDNWKGVLQSLGRLLESATNSPELNSSEAWDLLSVISIVFQYCALDTAISQVQMLEKLSRDQWEQYFLPFCNLFSELGDERFRTLLLPFFKRFISQKAHEHGSELCVILPQLCQKGIISEGSIVPSTAWQELMVSQFRDLLDKERPEIDSEQKIYACSAFLEAFNLMNISQETTKAICNSLHELLDRAVAAVAGKDIESVHRFGVGQGLQFLVQQKDCQTILSDVWPSLCQASALYGHSLSFWPALLALAEKEKSGLNCQGPHMEPFKQAIMRCLGSPSHEMRLAALGILEIITAKDKDAHNIISIAALIEQTPLNLETQRSVSMRIGQIAKLYPNVCGNEWVGEAIPTFNFGLLHVRLASVWNDACQALNAICETKEGEAQVSRIAFEWLADPDTQENTLTGTAGENLTPRRHISEFECTNIIHLEEKKVGSRDLSENVEKFLKVAFKTQHTALPFITSFSRTQALRVLDALPHVAEKRSRNLVPILLDWAFDQRVQDTLESGVTPEDNGEQFHYHWSRKDQKAMLTVFSKFNNPKVLFRSGVVYKALLALLSNGDVEIQKAALKALLTWKDAAVTKYQEELFNLLDEARFRDEISVFVSQDKIQEDHVKRVLPIMLRLLYGRIIAGKRGLESKRKAVFVAVKNRFGETAIHQFLGIALGPLDGLDLLNDQELDEEKLSKELTNPRKQVGMLNMLEDMLSTFKSTFTPFTNIVVDPVLYCLVRASRDITKAAATDEIGADGNEAVKLSLLKTVRQRALQTLNVLFETSPNFAWRPYAAIIVNELVNSRLEQFPIETAQSVSALLRLFAAWSKSALTALFLVEFNQDILNKVVDCLEVASAKDEVKRFVLDEILRSLISLVASKEESASTEAKILQSRIHTNVLQPYSNLILSRVGNLLKGSPSKEVLESGVQTVAQLAPHVVGSAESRSMIEISTFLLRQPSKRVNPRTKLGLLKILHEFVPRCDGKDQNELFNSIYDAVCPLFSFVHDQISRKVLCDIVQDLSEVNEELAPIAQLCHALNSFSTRRLDEPDFERRSNAFNTINEEQYRSYSLNQWKPLAYNMLYFIKDNDELSIRVNASLCLRRFIEASTQGADFKNFIASAILPGMQSGMRETSELVRVEFLAVLARLVKVYPDWTPVADMHALLSDDEEASFFGNVLHIQGHRRLRALRRLASHAAQLQSGNIYHIIIPLLEHFIFDKAEDEAASNLAGESIRTVSALAEWLEWPQFRSLLKRTIGYLTSKEDMQKTIIKLLVGLMDALKQAGQAKGYIIAKQPESQAAQSSDEKKDEDLMDVDQPVSTLSKTLPQKEKLTADLANNVLPDLTEFLHKKDEATVSLRVPVAVAVTKVLLLLPSQEIESRLPAVLLDICHILKSRAPESRDMSRNTLAEIATLMGPSFVAFILKALRTALQRGYQLHVLSYTLHHILVKMSENGLQPGQLDYCLPEIVDVIMDDTFGVTGQEKDADEYVSKMKEVKSSKSFDSMDIIARSATPSHLVDLVLPIKSLLQEKLNAKMVQKTDELLRRIGLGVLQNPTVGNRDILVFCYELIQEVYKASENPEKIKKEDPKNKRYLVNMRGAAKSGARLSTSSYLYKITRFGLDILRTVLRKHDELQTPQNLAGFLPIMGDAMVQGQEEVQISAVRLLTTIIKVPMTELDKNCPVYVLEAVRAIKGAPSSNTELAQASLKLVSAVLRERPNVEVKDRDIGHLLKRVIPDLDVPDQQGVTFSFLKAVMNRHFDIPELYEAMDKVAEMMVTNQTKSARDVARNHYFQFLTEYAQTEKRFKKQIEFLLRNLRYEHIEGRQSVMDALDLVISKALPRFPDKFQYDYQGMMFLPLVNTLANDDSGKCRELASLLIKRLFQYASDKRLQNFATDMRAWLEQDENTGLKRLGIQCWGFYFEARGEEDDKPKDLAYVLEQVQAIVQQGLERRDEDDWELLYYSLTAFSKLCKRYPDTVLSSDLESFWAAIQTSTGYPHGWVKLKSAELMGTYFSHLASSNKETGLASLPLEGSEGLQLTEEEMVQLTNIFLRNLMNSEVSEQLCMQSVKNLAFLARCFSVNDAKWKWQKADEEDAEDAAEENGITEDGDVQDDEEEWAGLSSSDEGTKSNKNKQINTSPQSALHRLMTRLSTLIRRETSSLPSKTATLSLLETITSKFPFPPLTTSLSHLLTTLNTLTDPATTMPRLSTTSDTDDPYKGLIDKAREIMNTLQKRMGTQEYLKVMSEVQKNVRERRDERRRKRKVEAVTNPERWEKEKKRRHDVSRVKRKERSAENRGRRRGW